MELMDRRQSGLPPAFFRVCFAITLASVLVHFNYLLVYGGAGAGQWFRSLPEYFTIGWAMHLLGLFGPSVVLFFLWARSKLDCWALLFSGLIAFLAYRSWQPLPLNILSAMDLYPTHLEAFHNWFFRDHWLIFEQPDA